jgi:hypothetical protein
LRQDARSAAQTWIPGAAIGRPRSQRACAFVSERSRRDVARARSSVAELQVSAERSAVARYVNQPWTPRGAPRYTFVPIGQPQRTAGLIREFARDPVAARRG